MKLLYRIVQYIVLNKLSYFEKSELQKAMLEANKVIALTWGAADVIQKAKDDYDLEITDDGAYQILLDIERTHDCCHGVTWDTLDYHISEAAKKLQ